MVAITIDITITSRTSETHTDYNAKEFQTAKQEAFGVDELASKAMVVTQQKLKFTSSHQLVQMAEMEIMEAYKKNHIFTDQSYAKHKSEIITIKRSVKKEKSNQVKEIRVQKKTKQSVEF